MRLNGTTVAGILICIAGWVGLLFFASAGKIGDTEIVNLHLVAVFSLVIITGLAIALAGFLLDLKGAQVDGGSDANLAELLRQLAYSHPEMGKRWDKAQELLGLEHKSDRYRYLTDEDRERLNALKAELRG